MIVRNWVWLTILAAVASGAALGQEAPLDERILRFHSDIVVNEDASLIVTETITVNALGQQIQRGIYRDFPTLYWAKKPGLPVSLPKHVGFHVVEVQRDGRPESYHTENVNNGVRVYFGREDVFLQPGTYTYTLVYKTTRQLGFLEDFDELYWNVTGLGWPFPIERAEAVVRLPDAIQTDQISVYGYTGPEGATGDAYTAEVTAPSEAHFATTAGLGPHEGLTVSVKFPKGYVTVPRWSDAFVAGRSNLMALAGLVGIALYYVFAWALVGIDPARGRIAPTDAPPPGFSPEALRYIQRMEFDKDTFTVALVNMATKGYLRIEQEEGSGKSYFVVRDQAGDEVLSPEETEIAHALFQDGDSVALRQANHRVIGGALDALKKSLKQQYEGRMFKSNTGWRVVGFLVSLALIAGAILLEEDEQRVLGLFMGLWLSGWTVAVFFLGKQVITGWRQVFRSRDIPAVGGALFYTLFAIPFFIGELFGLGIFAWNVSAGITAALVAMILLNVVFFYLMKAPTREGRAVLDAWEGFEAQLRGRHNPLLRYQDEQSQQQAFERYLPYALAVGAGFAWAEAFSQAAGAAAGSPASMRQPMWYHGPVDNNWSTNDFVSSLSGSFSSAIASSSTAPGSSSGGGGGGSSGGGGGGGGGGGW